MPEYGEYIQRKRREQIEEHRAEEIEKHLSGGYIALEEHRDADVARHCLWLAFLLCEDARYSYSSEELVGPLDDAPVHAWTGIRSLVRGFDGVVREETGRRRVRYPFLALEWFDQRTHIGRVIWSRWRPGQNASAASVPGVPSARTALEHALVTFERVAVEREIVENPREEIYEIGEDFEESPLHEMYEKRKRQGRSLQVIIVARDNATGTGKTTLAVHLCEKWGDEWTAENATNRPGEYRDFLNNKPEGSVLLADEIGQMYDSRRSMSEDNVEVSQDWQMIRTKQYKTLSTLPGPSFLDKRLKKLSDVMILCTRRGHARVYKTKVDDESGDLWREHLCNIEWGALDDDPEYQAIEEMKRERLRERFEGDGDDDPELTERDIEEAERRTRDELLRDVYEDTSLTQQDLADATGLSRSRVADVLSDG